METRPEGQRLGEAGVRLEALLREVEGFGGAVELRAPRLRQQGAGVGRVAGQRFVDERPRLEAVVLVEEEEAEVDARLGVAGVRLDRLLVGADRVVEEVGVAGPEVGDGGGDGAQVLHVEAGRVDGIVEVDEAVEVAERLLAVAAIEEKTAEVEPRELGIGGPAFDRQPQVRLRLVEAAQRPLEDAAGAGEFRLGIGAVGGAGGGPVEGFERRLVVARGGERPRPTPRRGRERASGARQVPETGHGLPVLARLQRFDGGGQRVVAPARASALLGGGRKGGAQDRDQQPERAPCPGAASPRGAASRHGPAGRPHDPPRGPGGPG